MNQVRAERVANGSNRRRDLAAVEGSESRNHVPEAVAFVAQHFPNESIYAVVQARYHLQKQGAPVTPAAVREWMRNRGSLRELNS